jgi:hypothetical protein
VPCIGRTCSFAGDAEGLAGTRAGPNRSIVWPSGEAHGMAPSADAGEEMALGVSVEVRCPHVNDAALVNIAVGDMSSGNEVAKPLGGVRIDFIVVGFLHSFSTVFPV